MTPITEPFRKLIGRPDLPKAWVEGTILEPVNWWEEYRVRDAMFEGVRVLSQVLDKGLIVFFEQVKARPPGCCARFVSKPKKTFRPEVEVVAQATTDGDIVECEIPT